MKSAYKFIQKLWLLNQKIIDEISADHSSNQDINFEKITNQFIKNVTNNIESFAYNKIIANFHELYSALNLEISKKIKKMTLIDNYKKILIVMSPIIPHFANECLEMINVNENIEWPKINKDFLIEKNIKFIVQINGKTRKILETKKDIREDLLITKLKDDSKINSYIKDRTIIKKIFIPNKLINIILS